MMKTPDRSSKPVGSNMSNREAVFFRYPDTIKRIKKEQVLDDVFKSKFVLVSAYMKETPCQVFDGGSRMNHKFKVRKLKFAIFYGN